jgi:uncharacterized protein YlzI (FlbEa/FlbD family)
MAKGRRGSMSNKFIELEQIDGTPVIINIEQIILFEPKEYRNHRSESRKWGTYIVLPGGVTRVVTDQFSSVHEKILEYQRSKEGE